MIQPEKNREAIFRYTTLSVTFVALLISFITLNIPFLKILPLFISLIVMLMQSNVNRYGYLLGGVNSILYAVIYVSAGVYASAASALLFSLPVQLITFLRLQKHSYKQSTVLKKLSSKGRLISLFIFFAFWCLTIGILTLLGSNFAFLDTSVSLLGIGVSILTMLAYKEYAPLWLLSSFLSLLLNIQMTLSDISFFPYVVSGVYNLICTLFAVYKVSRLYKIQRNEAVQ
jgi:nicotinamide mononucleotide transporter PnuC